MADSSGLTEQHRQAQLKVRAAALRDFLLLWPLWTGDSASFARLVQAAVPLIRVYHGVSTALAASYFREQRAAEGAAGEAVVKLAPAIVEPQVVSSLYVTGDVMTRDALAAGQSPQAVRTTALTRVSGAATRHILKGGRDTILQSVVADPHALGWARVTDGDPCYFCLTLASRGAVYKSEATADFEAHDHCGCSAMPVWDGTELPSQTAEWKRIYEQAQRDGIAAGDLQHGENPSSARLNAVRRFIASQ